MCLHPCRSRWEKGCWLKAVPKRRIAFGLQGGKDGAEIKSSSVAPYGQSLTGGEGHLRLAGGLSRALQLCLVEPELAFNSLGPALQDRPPSTYAQSQEGQVRSQTEIKLKEVVIADGFSVLGGAWLGKALCGFYIQIFTSHCSHIIAVGCFFLQLLLKLLFHRRTKDK